jgi:Tectonin domain
MDTDKRQSQTCFGRLRNRNLGCEFWGRDFFRDVPNDEWEIVSGQLDQISVAADGSIWGVNSNDDIFRR